MTTACWLAVLGREIDDDDDYARTYVGVFILAELARLIRDALTKKE